MKRLAIFFVVLFTLANTNHVSGQDFYKQSDKEEAAPAPSGFMGESRPPLKARPTEPPETPVAPIGDAHWLVLGLVGLYGAKVFYNKKRSQA